MSADARIVRRTIPEFAAWPDATPAVLQRIYAARGVCRPEDAELKLARLLSPETLGGLDAAVTLLAEAIAEHRHI
ncbi:MAG TPA: single-stranded-DNA-specific exonuclease RecJ, partial [Arenimonas sp.]|nr:single-stranded-DNA-specific exonuclease RecJ [Arenimonas sp.]